jgi:hypothetical protein
MEATIPHFLALAPHQLWQTAASPFILPTVWNQYPQCPTCGGHALGVCAETWPENWWEDDMLGAMYQGHIPPQDRISPWEDYYASSRVKYLPEPVVQTPLRIETQYYQPYEPHMAARPPMTPPTSPSVATRVPHWHQQYRPVTPTSPTPCVPHPPQTPVNSFDNVYGTPAHIADLGMSLLAYSSLIS